MLYPNLGKNIKKRRQKLGLTQKELAYMIMKSEISIRKYESGKVNIPPSTLFDICTVLNISSEELLGEDSDKYHLTHWGETLEQSLESARHKYKANLELEEALMNGSDNISELVSKVKKTTKKEVIHDFRKLIDSADWKKFKNVSDEDIYSVVMSIELYAYLQGLFDMQRKTNITPLPKREKQIWEEEGKEYLMPKASHDKEGDFTEEDYKHDDDLMNDEDLWK
ncbi:helix-turn-helix domain-containing protein [Clostridium perfringens]|uniref:helix-turn-helix domain-containing protein n=1 Tax=Clostridium perfringens TaxID=1502 RepID=UPI0029133159|nr:helix-turn-helix transcriptional regulator [Clostridium perfringens]MDU3845646.1 helix-turn-helix transcriptional regulator [Clostridium perfringens]